MAALLGDDLLCLRLQDARQRQPGEAENENQDAAKDQGGHADAAQGQRHDFLPRLVLTQGTALVDEVAHFAPGLPADKGTTSPAPHAAGLGDQQRDGCGDDDLRMGA